MSELQTENAEQSNGVINQETTQVDTGTVKSGADLATVGDENPDKINQDAVQERINKVTAKRYEAERGKTQAEKERDALQAKLDEIEASKPAPTVSPLPDRFDATDEEYEAALKKRDEELQAVASYNASIQQKEQIKQQQEQESQRAKTEKLNQAASNFTKRGNELGFTEQQMNDAAIAVSQIGIDPAIGEFILNQADGALILQHLAANPSDHYALNEKTPMEAALMINGEILQKAAALKPKTSNAPDPVVPLGGNGVDPDLGKYPNSKGATFS